MEPLYIETHRSPARTPLSLRVPTPLLERVQQYADARGITRTDAFLQLVDCGLKTIDGGGAPYPLASIERKVDQVLALLQSNAANQAADLDEVATVAGAVASVCKGFPAISKAYLFGSWARGTAQPQSDIDLRIEVDQSRPFNLHDLVRLSTLIEQATGHPADVVSARVVKNEALAAAIEREKVLVYEREE